MFSNLRTQHQKIGKHISSLNSDFVCYDDYISYYIVKCCCGIYLVYII